MARLVGQLEVQGVADAVRASLQRYGLFNRSRRLARKWPLGGTVEENDPFEVGKFIPVRFPISCTFAAALLHTGLNAREILRESEKREPTIRQPGSLRTGSCTSAQVLECGIQTALSPVASAGFIRPAALFPPSVHSGTGGRRRCAAHRPEALF